MRITINENVIEDEVEIIINCKEVDDSILKIIAALKSQDNKIVGVKSGQTFFIAPKSILYIESVDKKAFIYCEKEIYESPLRLYAMEEILTPMGFFRVSKSTIMNLSQVTSLNPDFGGRLIITMNNSEKIIVSRQYACNIKSKLGL